jgi:hypothetical protein
LFSLSLSFSLFFLGTGAWNQGLHLEPPVPGLLVFNGEPVSSWRQREYLRQACLMDCPSGGPDCFLIWSWANSCLVTVSQTFFHIFLFGLCSSTSTCSRLHIFNEVLPLASNYSKFHTSVSVKARKERIQRKM